MSKSEQVGSGIVIALILAQTVLLGLLVWRVRSMEDRLGVMQMTLGEALITPRGADAAGGDTALVDVDPGNGPARGAKEPQVTIVEFSDFTCSACRQFEASLKDVMEEHGEEVQLVYRYFPLAPEGKPILTALAAECSRRQDQFWPMHDALFAHADTLEGEADVKRLAQDIGLDMGAFETCLTSADARAIVDADAAAGHEYGVNATPTTFVNGRRVRGAVPPAYITQLIEAFKAQELRNAKAQGAVSGSP